LVLDSSFSHDEVETKHHPSAPPTLRKPSTDGLRSLGLRSHHAAAVRAGA
jgi:hypothetical protein